MILDIVFIASAPRAHKNVWKFLVKQLIFGSVFFSMSIFSILPISWRLFERIYFEKLNQFHLAKKPCSEMSDLKQPRTVEQNRSQNRTLYKVYWRRSFWVREVCLNRRTKFYCKEIQHPYLNKRTARTFYGKYCKNLRSKTMDLSSAKKI